MRWLLVWTCIILGSAWVMSTLHLHGWTIALVIGFLAGSLSVLVDELRGRN